MENRQATRWHSNILNDLSLWHLISLFIRFASQLILHPRFTSNFIREVWSAQCRLWWASFRRQHNGRSGPGRPSRTRPRPRSTCRSCWRTALTCQKAITYTLAIMLPSYGFLTFSRHHQSRLCLYKHTSMYLHTSVELSNVEPLQAVSNENVVHVLVYIVLHRIDYLPL